MDEAVTKQQVMDLLAAAAYLETDGASMPGAEADRIAATLRALASAPRAEAVEAISREYHAEITQQLREREAVLRDLLKECRYPLLVAKADAESAGEQEDLELLGALLRKINAALAAIAQGTTT